MRPLTISAFLILLALMVCAAAKEEPLAELKSRVERARPEDRPPLYMQIAHEQLRNADKLYTEGQIEQAAPRWTTSSLILKKLALPRPRLRSI